MTHLTAMGVLTYGAWLAILSPVAAEPAASRPLVASLTGSLISHENMQYADYDGLIHLALRRIDNASLDVVAPRRKPSELEIWEKFELEYRPPQWSTSPVLRPIEMAKYGADVATFAFDRFVRTVNDQVDFSIDHGRLRRTASINSFQKKRDNTRVKLDLELARGRPYLGLRVIIPIGK